MRLYVVFFWATVCAVVVAINFLAVLVEVTILVVVDLVELFFWYLILDSQNRIFFRIFLIFLRSGPKGDVVLQQAVVHKGQYSFFRPYTGICLCLYICLS